MKKTIRSTSLSQTLIAIIINLAAVLLAACDTGCPLEARPGASLPPEHAFDKWSPISMILETPFQRASGSAQPKNGRSPLNGWPDGPQHTK
jgi:hypothetical protein